MFRFLVPISLCLITCAFGCDPTSAKPKVAPKSPLPIYQMPQEPADPPPKTSGGRILIKNATIMTAAGQTYSPGYILFNKGLIEDVGEGTGPTVGEDTTVIDATGSFVTPGIIDTHSHMGVYAVPGTQAHSDGNEMVRPVTAYVSAEHSFWPLDPNLWRARSGGVTTVQILPGSGNLIGGRSFIAKLHPATSARAMRFPGAPVGLKMACGENPKRVYGKKGGPQTRMGNVAGYRKAFQTAYDYRRKERAYARDLAHWQKSHKAKGNEAGDPPTPPPRDFGLETLARVLDGKILVHNHCYRADEMNIMMDVAKEFGFKIRSFHHALEAYKIADRLADEKVASSTWADWWGFKMEAYDGIPQNAAILQQAGAIAIIHSDSSTDIRHLNQEAAKAQTAGKKIGIHVSDNDTLRWLTANPAWALGVDDRVGTLEKGKMADVVIWNKHPLSIYALAQNVFIDGIEVYNRTKGPTVSDFEAGHQFEEVSR